MKPPSAQAIRREAREEGESYEHERREYERGEEPTEKPKRKKQVKGEGEKGSRRLDRPGRKSGGRLSYAEREKMPSTEFALPGHGTGPKGKGGGSYPIPDESHARNALARVSQHGSSEEKAAVRRKVHAKYPNIGHKKD